LKAVTGLLLFTPNMITDKIKELAALKAQAAKLEAAVEAGRAAELSTLPESYGYASLKEFIKALKQAAKAKPKARKVKAAKAPKAGKKTRARITPEVKAQVKVAVEAGKTGAVIAKEFGISIASLHNVKKEFGLTKARVVTETPPAAAS
jgi:hypothetical protein